MAAWMKIVWSLLHYREMRDKAEVDQIGALQQAAKRRRAEYAEEQARAAHAGATLNEHNLASSRRRVDEAEYAHATALQTWNEKEFRGKRR